jgi:hypothetical protein
MEYVYHIVTIRVNETSWAHVWRLRSHYLRTGYDKLGAVLHTKWIGVASLFNVGALLASLRFLIKDNITGDDDTLVDRVVATVRLQPRFIADEDGLDAAIVQLLEVWMGDLDVHDTAEHVKVVNS